MICQFFFYHIAYGGVLEDRAAGLKVLQLNIWHEGSIVKGGFEAIVDEIVHLDPDVVFFSEVRNYDNRLFIPRILQALGKRGKNYYGESSGLDVGIIAKYRIAAQEEIYPDGGGCGSILRAAFSINGYKVAAYSAHLDYKNYACYMPRGYDGGTWKKMENPVTETDAVLSANRIAYREEAIQVFMKKAEKDIQENAIVLLGGDFNEPSHLDWQENTKHLWEHNGAVIPWDCSSLLLQNGFQDMYRDVYPNPVTHPGFTFPSDNQGVAVDKLSWAAEADERDRIDFIYYYPHRAIRPVSAYVVGPSSSIVKGVRVEEDTQDRFILPQGTWPSDHKGVLGVFEFR